MDMFPIRAALDWASIAPDSRTVDISTENKKLPYLQLIPVNEGLFIKIWCYDIKRAHGIYISMDWLDTSDPIGSIDRAINQIIEKEELELLRKLKEKYKEVV